MDQKPDLIKEDIAETRTALTDKLGALEDQLRDKVDVAKEKIRQFSPRHQVQEHPFIVTGVAAGVGYFVGRRLKPRVSDLSERVSERFQHPAAFAASVPASRAVDYEASPEYEGSWTGSHELRDRVTQKTSRVREQIREKGSRFFDKIREDYSDELGMLKGMALSAVLGVAREFSRSALPQKIAHEVDRVWDSALSKVDKRPQGQNEEEYRAGSRV